MSACFAYSQRQCRNCSGPLPQKPPRGRHPDYCGERCRELAKRRRIRPPREKACLCCGRPVAILCESHR